MPCHCASIFKSTHLPIIDCHGSYHSRQIYILGHQNFNIIVIVAEVDYNVAAVRT